MKTTDEILRNKANRELVILHKRVFKNYLVTQTTFASDEIQKVMTLYNNNITFKNIRGYYNHHVRDLLIALVRGQLNELYQPTRVLA